MQKKLFDYLLSQPVIEVKDVKYFLDFSSKAAYNIVNDFVKLNILKEITDFRRNRKFAFDEYIKLFK